jgi:hypothetical protein
MKLTPNKKLIFLLIFTLFLSSFSKITFAVWDGNPYRPGQVDNPECLPSQTNCDVLPAVTTETDPVFIASQAFTISAQDITNWKAAYNWGNHADAGYVTGTPWTEMGYVTGTPWTEMGYVTGTPWTSMGYLTSYTETDPIFSAWNKSTGISIKESQISDLQHYLTSYTETDPAFSSWLATTPPIYSETDPIFAASQAHNITSTDITNLSHLSGSNSGDETATTIKTKLGITTLSGSNTGDETATTIKTKLGITTLSGSNTGDQDLSGLVPYTGGTSSLTLSGIAARTFGMLRNTTAGTVGLGLTVDAGGAVVGGNNLAGGDLYLKSGISTGSGTAGIHLYTTPAPIQTATVGVSYGGGIIGYILLPGDTGYVAGKVMVLVVSSSNVTSVSWNNSGVNVATGANGLAIGTGLSNTNTIIAAQGAGTYAASAAKTYNGGGYSDWYLPSVGELTPIYNNRVAIGMPDGNYWASTEYNTVYAYYNTGGIYYGGKNAALTVRAIRITEYSLNPTVDNTPTEKMTILGNGNVGIGVTSPTAYLNIKGGTAAAGTAPLKFTSGTLTTTPEVGAMEFSTDTYYGTISTGTARKNFVMNNLGLAGGQTIVGGTAASDVLTLSSTSNATKGKINFGTSAYDEVLDLVRLLLPI